MEPNNHLLQLLVEGKIEGRRDRKKWLRHIKNWTEVGTTGELTHSTPTHRKHPLMMKKTVFTLCISF